VQKQNPDRRQDRLQYNIPYDLRCGWIIISGGDWTDLEHYFMDDRVFEQVPLISYVHRRNNSK